MNSLKASVIAGAVALVGFSNVGNAAVIQCSEPDPTPDKNYMEVDDSYVSSCLASGVGNINGSATNDDFLALDSSWTFASKVDGANNFDAYNLTYTQSGDTGTFSFDDSFWSDFSEGAIGFKFGTGNEPDEWFVYELVQGVDVGNWLFENVLGKGGGLSHVNLYGKGVPVPEPGTVAMFALGLLGLGVQRRIVAKG